jgi:hypothetical protein
MGSAWHDPLSTFCDAARSAIGWLFVIVGTSLLGLWVGMWIGFGALPSLEQMAWAPLYLCAALIFRPELLILFGVTMLLWYVPHRYESFPLRLGAAVVNCVAWIGFCAWAFHSLAAWQ